MKLSIIIIYIFNSLLFLTFITPLVWCMCVDERGHPVDYYLVYKIPKLEKSSNIQIRSGYGYAFISSIDANNWKLSNLPINDTDSIIGQTLKSLNIIENENSKNNNNFLIYNDQPPNGCMLLYIMKD